MKSTCKPQSDHGYFGKGPSGYAHYMKAFNRNTARPSTAPSGSSFGCLTAVIFFVVFVNIIVRIGVL